MEKWPLAHSVPWMISAEPAPASHPSEAKGREALAAVMKVLSAGPVPLCLAKKS